MIYVVNIIKKCVELEVELQLIDRSFKFFSFYCSSVKSLGRKVFATRTLYAFNTYNFNPIKMCRDITHQGPSEGMLIAPH